MNEGGTTGPVEVLVVGLLELEAEGASAMIMSSALSSTERELCVRFRVVKRQDRYI